MKKTNYNRTLRRKLRISSNLSGSEKVPRISIYRSNKYIYGQAIDDVKRYTIVAFSSIKLTQNKAEKNSKSKISKLAGIELAKLLKTKKIEKAVFDRGPYTYNGRVKAFAEGMREGGIII